MVARIASHPAFTPYGATELRRLARPHLVRATLAGSVFWITMFFALVAASRWWSPVMPPPPVVTPESGVRRILEPPPLIEPKAPPAVLPRVESPPSGWGVVIPTEIVDIPVEFPGPSSSTGEETIERAAEPANAGTDPGPPPAAPGPFEPVYVEKLPVAVFSPDPVYPDLAVSLEIEGLVYVRVLVGEDGRVSQAFVHKQTSVPVLDPAALEAARRWVFDPARSNGHPVPVWVSIPFRFTLRK